MPENLKTTGDTSYYNKDDFVEQDGEMVELTVTITLCEYRNMVRELARNELIIGDLQEQVKRLTDELNAVKARCHATEATGIIHE